MKTELPIVGTPSRVETEARCKRRGVLDNIVEIRPKGTVEPASTAFGTVMHAGVAAHWMREFEYADANPYAVLDKQYDELEPSLEGNERHTRELAHSLLRYYMNEANVAGGHWAADMPGWHVVEVNDVPMIEQRLEVTTPAGFRMRFMLDRLVQYEDRDIYAVVDLKTAASNKRLKVPNFYRDWNDQWDLSIQMRLYKWGVKEALAIDAEVWIEGLLKALPTQLRTLRCPDWSDSQLEEAVRLFDGHMAYNQQLVEQHSVGIDVDVAALTESAAVVTPFNLNDCNAYYHQCAFWPLCNARPEERIGIINSQYEYYEGDF